MSVWVRSYPLCFPKGLTHNCVPFLEFRRRLASLMLYICYSHIACQRCVWFTLHSLLTLKCDRDKYTPPGLHFPFVSPHSVFCSHFHNIFRFISCRAEGGGVGGGGAAMCLRSKFLMFDQGCVSILVIGWSFFTRSSTLLLFLWSYFWTPHTQTRTHKPVIP